MRSSIWSRHLLGAGIRRPSERLSNLALSQKVSFAFAFFLTFNAIQSLVDYGGFSSDSFAPVGLVAALFFVVVARFDNRFVRWFQVVLLLALSIVSVLNNGDAGDVAPFVLLSIGLAAAYKMSLFGRRTVGAVAWTAVAVMGISYLAGMLHGFTVMQRFNIINFVVVYLLLLYFLFEEEALTLKRQRDILTAQAAELRPFAELGSNVAGLVHDFRNDVAGVAAIASIERLSNNNQLSEKLDRYAERLTERIDSVLYVATAGDHYEPEEIRIDDMLRKVMYYFVGINRSIRHAVRIHLEVSGPITVVTRRNLILTILENVIKNSVEATEGLAERDVWIAARHVDGELEITVEHHGRLLARAIAADAPIDVRRSNYFRRGKSERPGGTGLGMINVIRALEILEAEMTMENLTSGVRTTLRHSGVVDASPE
jgi:signal transduction histidine kinase